MEKLAALFQSFKAHPVTTVLGVLGGLCVVLAGKPELETAPWPQKLAIIGGAASIVLLGGASADGSKQ